MIFTLTILIIAFRLNLQVKEDFTIELQEQEVVQMEEIVQTLQQELPPPPPRPPVPIEVPDDLVLDDVDLDLDAFLDSVGDDLPADGKPSGDAAPKRRRSRKASDAPSEPDQAGDAPSDDEITDAEMTQACSRAAAVITPAMVTTVLGEFEAKEPKGVAEKERKKFLKRLDSLIKKEEAE